MKHIRQESGFTLVEISLTVTVIVLLAVIVIPNLIRTRMSANDHMAKAILVELSTSNESYCISHSGNYANDIAALMNSNPPLLKTAYCGKTISGYTFTCTFGSAIYYFTATPVTSGLSGTTIYAISTGGVLTP